MKLRASLMSEQDMKRALKRMAHEIAERNHGCEDIVILGIRSRGVPLQFPLRFRGRGLRW